MKLLIDFGGKSAVTLYSNEVVDKQVGIETHIPFIKKQAANILQNMKLMGGVSVMKKKYLLPVGNTTKDRETDEPIGRYFTEQLVLLNVYLDEEAKMISFSEPLITIATNQFVLERGFTGAVYETTVSITFETYTYYVAGIGGGRRRAQRRALGFSNWAEYVAAGYGQGTIVPKSGERQVVTITRTLVGGGVEFIREEPSFYTMEEYLDDVIARAELAIQNASSDSKEKIANQYRKLFKRNYYIECTFDGEFYRTITTTLTPEEREDERLSYDRRMQRVFRLNIDADYNISYQQIGTIDIDITSLYSKRLNSFYSVLIIGDGRFYDIYDEEFEYLEDYENGVGGLSETRYEAILEKINVNVDLDTILTQLEQLT